jgi:hypothetical protein
MEVEQKLQQAIDKLEDLKNKEDALKKETEGNKETKENQENKTKKTRLNQIIKIRKTIIKIAKTKLIQRIKKKLIRKS